MKHRSILGMAALATIAAGCAQAQTTTRTITTTAPAVAVAAQSNAAASTAPLWWEAEKPTKTNFPPTHSFAPVNEQEAAVLSEGKWIGVDGKRDQVLFLEYTVNVPAAGTYDLYARKFWKHGPFRWKIGDGPWQTVSRDVALLDDAFIRQFVGANWVWAGTAAGLKPGPQTLRIELTENDGAAAFDAFVLTAQPFVARGKIKPGESWNRSEPGWFAFEPQLDRFTASPIDLRHLNEKFAGENGRIVVKGEAFVHEKTGKPVRFWAANTGTDILNLPPAQMAYMARMLAKYGVNLVRVHGGLWKNENFREPDADKVAKLQQFVAALKKEGIYTSLSIYFPLWLSFDEKSGFAGYTGGKHPFALLYFNPEFQEIYRGWWKAILTPKNPETGLSLAEDPAVAFAELVNEDSYFFWTFTPYENVPGPQMEILEKQFGDWAAKKYGSVEKALTTWGGQRQRGDDPAAGRVGFIPLYQIFNDRSRRGQDTAQFLTESQSTFHTQHANYLKRDLGYKGLVQGSNWITADARRLGPLDKLSNVAPGLDFLDRHGYFDAPHEGEGASYSLRQGQKYRDQSALLFSPRKEGDPPNFSLPLMDVRYGGLPSVISEFNWTTPNRYRADFPLLAAAYGALQGTDGLYFFALGGPTWSQTHSKFGLQTPVIMGQFPAAALLYRQGLVKDGPPVVQATLGISNLYALEGAPVTAPMNLEAFRAKDVPPGQLAPVEGEATIDPLAFLVGKVNLDFAPTAAPTKMANLAPYINREGRVVKSATGELAWNWAQGRMVVTAPAAQGVTGFLDKAGRVALPDVTIQSPLEYGTVLVVALDGKPLKTSSKMLLQVMSEDKNWGWKTDAPTGQRTITSLGAAPILVKNLAGTVSLTRPDAASLKVTALDANGYPKEKVAGGAKAITLKPNVLYYLIEK